MTGFISRTGIAVLAISGILAYPVMAADLPGSKDPPPFKRFQGSSIADYYTRSFDDYLIATGPSAPNIGFSKSETAEGQITRVLYVVPPGHTALEVFRNYETMLTGLGFAESYKFDLCGEPPASDDFYGKFYNQAGKDSPDNVFYTASWGGSCYLSAKGAVGGKQTTIGLLVMNVVKPDQARLNAGHGTFKLQPGQVLIGFDVVTGTQVPDQMVTVRASDMAKQLAVSGVVDIYGILFDTDKTAIKPESKATLDQVALLLKNDPSLNLEVSGHTDNSGAADHNMTLSQGRAAAVVDALVKTYGIAASRLHARGFGATKPVASNATEDGKAKNRRVELRKM